MASAQRTATEWAAARVAALPDDGNFTRRIYMDEQVDAYWIVDADAWCIERWRRGDDRPEIVTETLAGRPEGRGRRW